MGDGEKLKQTMHQLITFFHTMNIDPVMAVAAMAGLTEVMKEQFGMTVETIYQGEKNDHDA